MNVLGGLAFAQDVPVGPNYFHYRIVCGVKSGNQRYDFIGFILLLMGGGEEGVSDESAGSNGCGFQDTKGIASVNEES